MSGAIGVSPRPGELDDHAGHTVKRSGLSAICATRTTPLAFCCQESFPANCFDTDTILSLPGKARGSCTGTGTRHGARDRAVFQPFQPFPIISTCHVSGLFFQSDILAQLFRPQFYAPFLHFFNPWFGVDCRLSRYSFIFINIFSHSFPLISFLCLLLLAFFTNYKAGFHGDSPKFRVNFCIISTISNHNFPPFSSSNFQFVFAFIIIVVRCVVRTFIYWSVSSLFFYFCAQFFSLFVQFSAGSILFESRVFIENW